MKKLQIYFAVVLICLSLFCIEKSTYAATAWEKNEQGIYINSQGKPIDGAAKRGIDISKYQYLNGNGIVDWNRVVQDDIDFVIIRTGFGKTIDYTFTTSLNACESLNMPYGVYHYSHAKTENDAREEANLVLAMIGGHKLSYPVYYDMEADWMFEALTPNQCMSNAKAFCEVIEAAGYEAGVYANKEWYQKRLTDPWFKTKERWIARPIYDYRVDWSEMNNFTGLWQCTHTGSVDGIVGNVDINFLIEGAPSKVSGLRGSSETYNKHKLTWESIPGVSGYEIWCKKPGSNKYTRVAKVAADVTSYTVGKRTTGKYYYYKIRAYKWINGKAEFGAYSNVKKVKAVPGTVNLQSVKRSSKTKVTLRWKKVSGASGYKIYYSKTKGSGYKLLKTIKKGSTTSVKVDVKKGKKYYYKIRAYKNVSKKPVYGKYSSVKSCK